MSSWSDGNQINTDGSVVGRLGLKAADYVIWKNGSDYEAVDKYGKIAYGGSGDTGGVDGADAAAVINAAFAAGDHVISAVEGGTLSSTITLGDGQVFEGLYFLDDDASIGASYTMSADASAITVAGMNVQVRNLKLQSQSGNTTALIAFDEAQTERHCLLENLGLIVYGHDAITIGDLSSFWNTYRNIRGVNLGASYDCYVIHSNDTTVGPGHLIEQISAYHMSIMKITNCGSLIVNGAYTDITTDYVNPPLRLSAIPNVNLIGIEIEGDTACPIEAVLLSNCHGFMTGRLYQCGNTAHTFFPVKLNSGSVMCFDGVIFQLTGSNRDWTCADANTAVYIHGTGNLSAGAATYYSVNSGSSTGTGAQQTIAHSLHGTPSKVILWDIESGAAPYQSAAADATNIYVTATNNQDWGWEASI